MRRFIDSRSIAVSLSHLRSAPMGWHGHGRALGANGAIAHRPTEDRRAEPLPL